MKLTQYLETIMDALKAIFVRLVSVFKQDVIQNMELVSLSDTGMTVTWVTRKKTRTRILYGKDEMLPKSSDVQDLSKWHYVELDGLDPETRYYYEVGGNKRISERKHFETLSSPGQYLFSFATLADLHIGDDNSKMLAEQCVSEINERGVDFTIVKGDLANDGSKEHLEGTRDVLDRLQGDYYPIIGNHDVWEYEDGKFSNEYFLATFAHKLLSDSTYYSFDYQDHHFICMDSVSRKPAPFGNSGVEPDGELSGPQLVWLENDLEQNIGKPIMVFMHHPVTEVANANSIWPFQMAVETNRGGKKFRQLISRYKVTGVFSGHTHRNEVTYANETGSIPYPETASTKEYPCGYNVYRVHIEGYIQTFYKCKRLDLSENSRKNVHVAVFGGLVESVESGYKFGNEDGERNFVCRYSNIWPDP